MAINKKLPDGNWLMHYKDANKEFLAKLNELGYA